jgi:hypothetical protein
MLNNIMVLYRYMTIFVAKRDQVDYQSAIIRFWENICQTTKEDNPAWDNSGGKDESFNMKMKDEFFFLSFRRHGESNRTCSVPKGKRLFIPAASVEVSKYERPEATVDDLKVLALRDQNEGMLWRGPSVVLDGVQVFNINHYNIFQGTDPFMVTFPSSNPIFPGGGQTDVPVEAVAAGRYIISDPLSEGTHTVRFGSTIQCPPGKDCIEEFFHEDVTYELTVVN